MMDYFKIGSFVNNLCTPDPFCRRSSIIFLFSDNSRFANNVLIIFVITISFDTINEVIYFGLSSLYVQLLALQNIKELSSVRKNALEAIDEEHEREVIYLG